MSDQGHEDIAALKQRIADLEARLVEADEYRKAWLLYDKEGILPPRSRELEEARRNGVTSEGLIGEMEQALARKEGAA